MTNNPPPFLRLHIAEELVAPPSSPVVNDTFEAVANAFQIATGWPLDREPKRLVANSSRSRRLESPEAREEEERSADASPIERWRAAELAEALSDMFVKLGTLQSAIWQREAELAIGIPVSPKRQEEEHLAARLETMLRNGAQAVGCCAAGLYLLDDATTELKLRACSGLPKDRFLEPARPLADAFAELEALLGHAVVLEDASLLPHWKTPESFPAALCLPVASPTDPLGTLWFFADSVRDFTDQEIHLAEIVAGSLAAELQREVLLAECLAAKQADRQIIHAVRWQHDHLPTIKPLVEGWGVAAWSATDDELASGFYDWFVPPDGSLAVALGTCDGLRVESALSAGALQASVRAHSEYSHDAATMISRANETVWNSSAGGHLASLFYGKATPGSGEIEYSTAGTIRSMLVRKSDLEVIHEDTPSLGSSLGQTPDRIRHRLVDGDVLLMMSSSSKQPSRQLEIARQLRMHRDATPDQLLQLVRSIDRQATLALILQCHQLQ